MNAFASPTRARRMPPAAAAALSMLILLAACGGGGGDETTPPSAGPGSGGSGGGGGGETINGISVPAAPDPTVNASTLAGVDQNANRVRDDIERELAQAIAATPQAPAQQTQAVAVAAALQTLVTTPAADRAAALALMRLVQCNLWAAADAGTPVDLDLARLADTPQRRAAFNANALLLGHVTTDELGGECP